MDTERTRQNSLLLVAALLASLLAAPAGPAGAQQTDDEQAQGTAGARDVTEHACPRERVPDAGFTDVGGNTHETAIVCLAWYGITRGGPGGMPADRYGPGIDVRRDQMASFIARLVDHADADALPPSGTDGFSDVGEGNVHRAAVERLAAAGIVLGRGDGTYAPAEAVRRDQMASFIARAMDLLDGGALPPGGDAFADVAEANPHRGNINRLAAAGIVQGRGGGEYAPAAAVRRDAMASFIVRSLDVLIERGVAGTADAGGADEPEPATPEALPETPEATPEAVKVTITTPTVERGELVRGRIEGGEVEAAKIGGACVDEGDLSLGPDGAFSRKVRDDAKAGVCKLGFTIKVGETTEVTREATVTVLAPTGNQSFLMTGDRDAVLIGGTVTCTASVPSGTTVNIRLFPRDNLVADDDGIVRFIHQTQPEVEPLAAHGAAAPVITSVNDAAVSAAAAAIGTAGNGRVRFTIHLPNTAENRTAVNQATSPAVVVTAAVWIDKAGGVAGRLDLDAADNPDQAYNAGRKLPIEQFGAGCTAAFLPAEAPTGTHTNAVVQRVYTRDSVFVGRVGTGPPMTFFYNPDDVFREGGASRRLWLFEEILSFNDRVSADYVWGTGGGSTFNITSNATTSAQGGKAVVKDLDGSGRINDVELTWVIPPYPEAGARFTVSRRRKLDVLVGNQQQCDDARDDPDSSVVFVGSTGGRRLVDSNVPRGCYVYSGAVSRTVWVPANTVTTPPPDTTRPTSTSAQVVEDKGAVDRLDQGDVLRIVFSEPMAAPATGARITVRDGDLTTATVTNGSNATFALNDDGRVLTITLTGNPAYAGSGPNNGIDIPCEIVAHSGITDKAGNEWNIGGSSDRTLDKPS